MEKSRLCYFDENLQIRPIFNQESNGTGLRSGKRPLVGHIGGQRSICSKIDIGRTVPCWKAKDSNNLPTSKYIFLNDLLGVISGVKGQNDQKYIVVV